MDYQSASSFSREYNERNDCAVKAVSIATGAPYAQVHAIMKRLGRKNRGCTYQHITFDAIEELGFVQTNVTDQVKSSTVRTIEREMASASGSFLVFVSRHVLCVKEGKVEDWSAGSQKRVKTVYSVVKKGEKAGTIPASAPAQVQPAQVQPATRFCQKSIIWGNADRMWAEAGRPMDKATILALRKDIMDVLGGIGIKRTTASVELGNWQKVLLEVKHGKE